MKSDNKPLGDLGERLARRYLERAGYRILATNYRSRWGEIDIIAQDADAIVMVEVKTRRSRAYGVGAEALTQAKTRKLIATANEYLSQRDLADAHWRIDLIMLETDSRGRFRPPEHLRNAVTLDGPLESED